MFHFVSIVKHFILLQQFAKSKLSNNYNYLINGIIFAYLHRKTLRKEMTWKK
jgi:hypothetical protein